jgi:AmiR/NasT family two-component response regulator
MNEKARIIIALSDRAESAVLADWLASEGFEPVRRPTPHSAVEEMRSRPYDVLIADASTNGRPPLRAEGRLRRAATPAILIGNTAPQRGEAVTTLPMYLARPLDRAILNCYVTMAILEGSPLRRSERKLVTSLAAVVNGVPAQILDVSVEGVRIEMLREKRTALPPYFTVRVPLMGVGVNVRRVWACAAKGPAPTLWYGGSLLPNRASALQGWKSLIETVPTVSTGASIKQEC